MYVWRCEYAVDLAARAFAPPIGLANAECNSCNAKGVRPHITSPVADEDAGAVSSLGQ